MHMYVVCKFQDKILWVTASDGSTGRKYNGGGGGGSYAILKLSVVRHSKAGIRLWHVVW